MKLLISIAISLVLLCSSSWVMADYTGVSQWPSCVKSVMKGPYKFFCLPKDKPEACPAASWNTLTKGLMLPWCPLCPMKPTK